MITIQEEILGVEMLNCETDWPVNDRLADLNSLLTKAKTDMHTINDLLGEQLTTDTPTLLEKIMCSLRTHTITY